MTFPPQDISEITFKSITSTDFINMIHYICEADVESYARQQVFDETRGYITQYDFDFAVENRKNYIMNYLVQQGFFIVHNFPSISQTKSDVDTNLELTNINLNKEVRKLRHNVSELQKQVNKLTEEKEAMSATMPQGKIKISPSPDGTKWTPWVEKPSICELYTEWNIDNAE